jgi:uncharacterized protein
MIMNQAAVSGRGLAARSAQGLARHAGVVLSAALLVTAALAVPLLAMPPDEFASQEPEGPVFDARDEIEERFGSGVVGWFFIVEARDGEMLAADNLLALRERERALEEHPRFGPMLLERTDRATGEPLQGIESLAATLDRVLTAEDRGLDEVDDATARATVSGLLDDRGPADLGVSTRASRDDDGRWSAPAVTVSVLVDADGIEGRGSDAGFGSDVAVEEAGRQVQSLLRDTDALDVWGVAMDQNLTGSEQGEAAGPFIGFTVLAIVLLVGLAFRSYWALAVVGAGLAMLLVWLQGLANLVGLKEDQILSTVVPIAMIAFGVDYAFHALGRYREERASTTDPRRALGRGLGGVLPALLLALATGVFAFLANASSGIESITQFGVAAAIALASAFVVLGVVAPVAIAAIDRRLGPRRATGARWLAVAGGLGAATMAMVVVLFTVFLSPPVGLALLAAYLLVFLGAPLLIAGRSSRAGADPAPSPERASGPDRIGTGLGRLVAAVAARRRVVLPAVTALSLAAAVYAVQVPASFDVEDFFAQDTDFVVGLDKLDEHIGDQGGEEAVVLATGDLAAPGSQAVLADFAEQVADLDTPLLAHDVDGRVSVWDDALDVLAGTDGLTPLEAAQVVAPADDDGLMAARLGVGLVGSRAQENVEATRDLLEPLVADLDADLAALHPDAGATLTGTPIVRQASLDAVSRSLQVSLPIAVLLCLLVTFVFLRSWRYATVSMVPILLVVAWLYGFMYLAGFSLNLVTATIGAISIGIGIDFSTHMTMRYREELAVAVSRLDAVRRSAAGTGTALVGSTVSSMAGFAILAFAPMPMFASFGLLTAVMIGLALVATLLVLPGLLLLVSREPDRPEIVAPTRATMDPPVPTAAQS